VRAVIEQPERRESEFAAFVDDLRFVASLL
jgi:hypothetical protein